ncbi:TspO protein [Candidatus Micrarchaeota archaeon CG10_big_fil_rev_8_21_14_0_10_59_7]|nr:MAG: TspO protein [Candidatus Micrarchaeota archaeon CG10_big_fil_rev_8_21_14_0_10_59_7]
MKKDDVKKLVLSLGACFAAAAIGSFFTMPSIATWYASLAKPAFAPPNWMFAPAWTLLYAMMGIALFLVWREAAKKGAAMTAFGGQLFLNALWSAAFFGAHSPFFGFVVIVLLWLTILDTIIEFRKISEAAAWLLVPYFFWVSFAACLNYSIWMLNP